jgi:regulation of enolase protein 1 (concanavalin A-like superfamily)
MKNTELASLLFSVLLAAPLMAANDNFNTPHDYLKDGVAGTVWDGFIGKGPYQAAEQINASISTPGVLRLQSSNGVWSEPYPPNGNLGPFLYQTIPGDFVATVRVTAYQGTIDAPVWYNAGGLMARIGDVAAAGPGEDWIANMYFPEFSVGNKVDQSRDGRRSEDFIVWNGADWNAVNRYLQLERAGNRFYCRMSPDGITWTLISGAAFDRPDFNGLPVQVGMMQCTYSGESGYVEFDDFQLDAGTAKATSPVMEQGETTGTATVKLKARAPTANVTVVASVLMPADPNDPNSIIIIQNKAVFTPSDWATGKTISYKALDDQKTEGPRVQGILFAVTSDDKKYDGGRIAPVYVRAVDSDGPDVIIKTSDGSIDVMEGGATDTISVALSYPPTADVTVAFAGTGVTVTPAQRVFTPANYATFQNAVVAAVDDAVVELDPHPGPIAVTVTSTDPVYSGLVVPAETALIGENDCGAWNNFSWDRNMDCVVNLADFAELAKVWLNCTVPYKGGCVDTR